MPPSSPPDDRSVPAQLLTAAVEAATLHGIARLSMRDVAGIAGLSRQTIYRHFSSKEMLVAAVIRNETALLIDRVVSASRTHDDPRDALEAALLAAMTAAREHPLLDRLLRTEPESLLALLTTDGGPVMGMVRAVTEHIIAERVLVDLDTDAPATRAAQRRLADIITRLLVSYAVSAPDDPPEIVAASLADLLIHATATGQATATTASHDCTSTRRSHS